MTMCQLGRQDTLSSQETTYARTLGYLRYVGRREYAVLMRRI
jgi:hypothetical protein